MTRPPLPDGLVAIVKRDCPTCELVAPVLAEIAGRAGLAVYSQDDPAFPEGVAVIDDTGLEVSYHHEIEAVPTLIRVDGGREVARTLHWDPATSETRFVVVTGSIESRRVLTEWEVPPDAVLEKPYDPVDLVDAVLEAARRGMRVVHLPDGERQKV